MDNTVEHTFEVRASEDLGGAIAEIRRTQALTQADVATLAGLTPAYLAKIEHRTSSVTDHQIRALRRLGATITIAWPASG